MKKIIYNLIHFLGYKIENKSKIFESEKSLLAKYNIKENFDLIFKARKYIHSINSKFEDFSIVNYNEGFIISFFIFKIYLETVEEFFILNEVFVDNDYNFITVEDTVVIDIGANIGISSLFFSSLDFVQKIYSFEPVYETYNQAKYNFLLNNSFCKVVNFQNIGLGNKTRTEVFKFDNEVKGNTGVRGVLSPSYKNNDNIREVEVQIVNASEEFKIIINENYNKKIVVKMDCEGAEYEILECLKKSGVIKSINVFMLEWHDRGACEIENILKDSGFEYFSKTLSPISGLIYAFKK